MQVHSERRRGGVSPRAVPAVRGEEVCPGGDGKVVRGGGSEREEPQTRRSSEVAVYRK